MKTTTLWYSYLLIAPAIALGDLFLLPTQSPTCFSFTSARGTSCEIPFQVK